MELERTLDKGFAPRGRLPVSIAPHCNSSTNVGSFAGCHLTVVEKNTFLHIVDAPEEEDATIAKGLLRSRSDSSFSFSNSYPAWKPLRHQCKAPQFPRANVEAKLRTIPQSPGVNSVDEPSLVQRLHSEGDFPMTWLLAMNAEELLGLIPRNAAGEMASVGSFGHAEGNCQPCLFMRRSGDCNKGLHCRFCHMLHNEPKKARMRPSKKTRKKWARMEWASHVEEEGAKEGLAKAAEDSRLAASFDPYDPRVDCMDPDAPPAERSLLPWQRRGGARGGKASAGRAGPSRGGWTA